MFFLTTNQIIDPFFMVKWVKPPFFTGKQQNLVIAPPTRFNNYNYNPHSLSLYLPETIEFSHLYSIL
jgi:hypothetical protein